MQHVSPKTCCGFIQNMLWFYSKHAVIPTKTCCENNPKMQHLYYLDKNTLVILKSDVSILYIFAKTQKQPT